MRYYGDTMGFRQKRQLIVFAIILVVLGGIAFFVVRSLIPEPTCRDNRQNQTEEGVDCGGPCISCAFRNQKGVNMFWVRSVKVRANTYDVVAEISNPNVKLAATGFEYEFKLYDTAGVLVASRQGKSYLYPKETLHLAEIGLTSGHAIRNVDLVIRNTQWALGEEIGPDVIAGNRAYAVEDLDGLRRSVITATLTNRTIADVPDIRLTVVALDDAGNLLGVNSTAIDFLPAGSAQPIKFTWPDIFPSPLSSILLEARSPVRLPKPSL